jgi:hypothetical protein
MAIDAFFRVRVCSRANKSQSPGQKVFSLSEKNRVRSVSIHTVAPE